MAFGSQAAGVNKLSEFQEFVIDQLGEAGDIQAKRMFGGVGVYVEEVFCAILTGEGRFYLRVDDGNREAFVSRGLAQMRGNGKAMMPYFQVPAEVMKTDESWRSGRPMREQQPCEQRPERRGGGRGHGTGADLLAREFSLARPRSPALGQPPPASLPAGALSCRHPIVRLRGASAHPTNAATRPRARADP
ncbi:MAG: TfoX/Sxy family protein [bacterium]|nr:TfoX/Sxy family protein [bacterium]